MLEWIAFRNLQALTDFKLELGPQITTIIGPSDEGKSACIRGLRWLALNTPSPGGLRTWGTDTVAVRARVDGQIVTRVSGPNINGYKLGDQAYKAIGRDVPEPVANLLRMDHLNFQLQLDAPFWLSDTAGQVAKSLNAIVDLGSIDDILGRLAARNRKAAATVEITKQRYEAAEAEAKCLKFADELALQVGALQTFKAIADKQRKAANKIKQDLADAAQQRDRTQQAQERAQAAAKVHQLAAKAEEHAQDAARLRSLIASAKLAEAAANNRPVLGPLVGLFTVAQEARQAANDFAASIADYTQQDQAHSRALAANKVAQDAHRAAKAEGCPVCGQPIKS